MRRGWPGFGRRLLSVDQLSHADIGVKHRSAAFASHHHGFKCGEERGRLMLLGGHGKQVLAGVPSVSMSFPEGSLMGRSNARDQGKTQLRKKQLWRM